MAFPKHIDEEFELLAKYKRENFPFKYWVENPIKRIYKCGLILFLALDGPMKYLV